MCDTGGVARLAFIVAGLRLAMLGEFGYGWGRACIEDILGMPAGSIVRENSAEVSRT